MLIAGAVYRTKVPVSLEIPKKQIQESVNAGDITYLFGTSVVVEPGKIITVLQSKKTTLSKFSKILYENKIYDYWYGNGEHEKELELVC